MTLPVLRERLSPNQDGRGEPPRIDMLVLHYTGMQSGAAAIERLCDPAAKVSSHYVVEEDGIVWRLVPDDRRAWHAGISYWEGGRGLNYVSLGIEIVNPGHEWGYRAFPEAQMAAVEALCLELIARHRVPAHRVVGHSDIAPERKADPGELFDWPRLARAGIGIWRDPSVEDYWRGSAGAALRAWSRGPRRCRTWPGSATTSCRATKHRRSPRFSAAFGRRRWDGGRLDAETASRLGRGARGL